MKLVLKGLLILFVTMTCSCTNLTGKENIKGKVYNMGDDKAVLLFQGTPVSDTVKVKNGVFAFNVPNLKSNKYLIYFINNEVYLPGILDNNQIEIVADLKHVAYDHLQKVQIYGTNYNYYLRRYEATLDSLMMRYDKKYQDLYFNNCKRTEVPLDGEKFQNATAMIMKENPNMMTEINDLRYELMCEAANDYFIIEAIKGYKSLLTAEQYEHLVSLAPGYLKETNSDMRKLIGYSEKQSKLAKGKPAIDFTLEDIDGKPVSLKDFRGKIIMLDFWASWCGPCRAAFPHVRELYNKYKDKGFVIIGVSVDRNADKWVAASNEENISWINLIDNKKEKVASKYLADAIPTVVLINQKGEIVYRSNDPSGIDAELEKLLE